ncbi:MAG: SDR family NAD(P)-dependent oxidoreductase [Bdellovibrionota bacterium]
MRSYVLITGASSGIGRALALEGAKRGYDLILVARREALLESLKGECLALDPKCDVILVAADVTNAGVESVLASSLPPGRELKIAFANAGVASAGKFEKLTIEEYQRVFDVNVTGVIRTSRAVLPLLEKSRGHLAIMGSLSGHIANPLGAPYNVSKYAVRGFAETLRAEIAHRGVQVSLISPGPVKSEIFQKNNKGEIVENPLPTLKMLSARTAARRMFDGVLKGKRDFSVHWQMTFALLFGRTFPGTTSWLMKFVYRRYEARFLELVGKVNPDSV